MVIQEKNMWFPKFIYRSQRVGKNGKVFSALKFKTLKDGTDKTSNFAQEDQYLRFGKFLRKYKLDELPQIINVLKGDMALVGPRPENAETIHLIPKDIRDIILSVKPGLTSLASIHFVDEEKILQQGLERNHDYYAKIKPIKIILDVFYVQQRDIFLDFWVIWKTAITVIKRLFKA